MTVARVDLPTIRIRRGPAAVSVLRAVAKTTLLLGALVAGFVAYEFGVTTFLAARGQSDLRDQLETRLATTEIQAVRFEAADLPRSPVLVPDDLPALDPLTIPGFVAADVALPGDGFEAGFIISEPAPLQGEALGRIVIPSAGVDWTVVEGTDRAALKTGAGHIAETALPGQQGNSVISGHRTTHGAPFLHLDRVQVGDAVLVRTATGTHLYQVVDTFVVDPSETWVTTQWEGAWLTLTTCEPVLSASKRLVVVATLVAGPNTATIFSAT